MNGSSDRKTTEDLIGHLASGLEPVRVLSHPLKRVFPWIGLVIAYMTVVIYMLGLRPDMAEMLHNPSYLFELSITSAMAVTASFAAIWLCVPDMRGQEWIVAPPLVLLGVFTLWTGFRIVLAPFEMPHHIWSHCSTDSILFGIVPAATIFFLSMKGKTTHIYLLPLMNALAVGGPGYVALRMTCASEDIAHILTHHTAPYILFALLAVAAGRRIYRW